MALPLRGSARKFDVGEASHALVIIAATSDSALGWLERAPRPFVIVNKSLEGIPNTGMDASSYLWWILQNYHALPTWMCFMHPHEYHWHHPFYSQLISMALDVDKIGAGYLNLAHDKEGRMLVYNKQAVKELNKRQQDTLRTSLLDLDTPYLGNITYAPGARKIFTYVF